MNITDYCTDLPFGKDLEPWTLLDGLERQISNQLATLDDEYTIQNDIAIHKTAKVDPSAAIKPPAIIGPGCFVGPHSLLRGGVYLQRSVNIGPSCEVKHSVIGNNTALAHFNFVGDSVVGANANFEAGAITANHYNERQDKTIRVLIDGRPTIIPSTKFGALIGDNAKVGANAVTSPGTILAKASVVKRLELIEQIPFKTAS